MKKELLFSMRKMQKGQAGHRHRTVHGDGAEKAVSIDTVVPCYGGCGQLNTKRQSLPSVGRPKEVENRNWNQACKWTGIGHPREPLLTVGELKQGLGVLDSGTLFWKVLEGLLPSMTHAKSFQETWWCVQLS